MSTPATSRCAWPWPSSIWTRVPPRPPGGCCCPWWTSPTPPPWPSTCSAPPPRRRARWTTPRSEEHTSELQSRPHLVCRLLLEKKKFDIRFEHLFHFHTL